MTAGSRTIELKRRAVPENEREGTGAGLSHVAGASQEHQDLRLWTFRRFVKEAYMLLAPVLSSPIPRLQSIKSTQTKTAFEAALREAIQKDGGKSQEQMYPDWVLLSKSSREHQNGQAMHSETIQVLLQEWERLQNKRLDLMSQRVKVREARTKLRSARTAMRESDTTFERALRRVFANDTKYGLKEIEDLYEQLQESREALRAQEEAYDVLENDLLVAEFEMRQVEDEIHGQLVPESTSLSEVGDEAEAPLGNEATNSAFQNSAVTDAGSVVIEASTESWKRPLTATDRLLHLEKQLRKLRRSMTKVNRQLSDLQENLDLESDLDVQLCEEHTQTVRELSERQSDLSVQIILLEEDAVRLEDVIFHQEDDLFRPDVFGLSANVVPTPYQAGSPIMPQQEDMDEWSDSGEPPRAALDFQKLSTKLLLDQPQAFKLILDQPEAFTVSGVSTVSGYVNSWLLEIVYTSRLDALLLHTETNHAMSGLNTVQRLRAPGWLWFSDGSQLFYATGRKEDVQSMHPWSSTDLRTRETQIWDSGIESSSSDPFTDDRTVIYKRGHPSGDLDYSDEREPEGILVIRSSSHSITNFEQGLLYHNNGPSKTGFEHVAKDEHPLISSLDTRPLAIHYLLQLSNSSILPPSEEFGNDSPATAFEHRPKDVLALISSLNTRQLAIHYLLQLSKSSTLPWSFIRQ